MRTRAIALVLVVALLPGCFGYNRSSKGWAYVGDTMLLAAGGAGIAVDATSKHEASCDSPGCKPYTSPVGGMLVAGVVVATAGLVGILLNATRANVRASSH